MLFSKSKNKPNLNILRSIFDSQIITIANKGYLETLAMGPEEFNNNIESLWNSLSARAESIEFIAKGTLPLLVVINAGDTLEKIKKINGHTELNLNNLKKEHSISPDNFYLLLDVENGTKTVAKSPKDSLKQFGKDKRSALTLNESISLLMHYPEILKNHYVISAGTFYAKDNEEQPLLWLLDEDKNPELHYAWLDIAHGSYGTASCAIKIYD